MGKLKSAAGAAVFGVVMAAGAAQAQISDDVVKIAILTDMSSVYSDSTGMGSVVSAELAVADMGGKVAGKPVQVIYADHQNKPDIGSAIARNWIDNEKVDMIGDVPTSSIALAVQKIVRDKNRVLMISGGGSSDLTGEACSPNGIHWTYDTYAQAAVPARALLERGEKSWFFVTADYAFGHALERDASAMVRSMGGTVLGSVRHPLNSSDFASFLLQAQGSKAQVVAFANAGGDSATAIKQAAEFGIRAGGQIVVPLLISAVDVKAVGLQTAQGMTIGESFYWDANDGTRAFAKRYMERMKRIPTSYQAGMYSATLHYLRAIEALGTDEAGKVIAKMKATPVNDMFAKSGHIREDGRMVHDMYLYEVKKPSESKGEWDVYKLVATVPGDQAFRPMDKGGCPFLKNG